MDPSNFPNDCKGWGSRDPYLSEVVSAVRPKIILEVGTWKGASAIYMAECCEAEEILAEIICVDPHIGSAGLWLHNQEAMYPQNNGQCGTYEVFLANVKRHELTNVITPFRATASIATAVMLQLGIQPDLVFIDGSHDEIDVSTDLTHVEKVLHQDSVIVCDDYGHPRITGVTNAVNSFLNSKNCFTLAVSGDIPLDLYTEKVVNGETAKKAVLTYQEGRYTNALNKLSCR